ncbi:MAG: NAD-dependent epimerase/dehydratase family protein, partial [Thermomicrobiales bacterium]
FIGSHLVDGLLAAGHAVRVLDDLSTGRLANLADVRGEIEMIDGDIRGPRLAAAACAGVEVVFHQAGVPSVKDSIADPVKNLSVNIDGTLSLLYAAREAGVRRFLLASSSAVYGGAGEMPRREDMLPAPESPYAAAKLSGEHLLDAYRHVWGMETVVLRYFNVFGPRQDPDSPSAMAPSLIARAIADGLPFTVFGDGGQSRDFVPVANVVAANLLCANAPGANGGVFNVGTGVETSINQTIATMTEMAGRDIEVSYAPPRAFDLYRSVADISAISRLGYRPVADFREGCRRLLAGA